MTSLLVEGRHVTRTVVSVKGEEKSRQMNRCYHGADGKVQKIPLTTPEPPKKKRGLRGKIAESKQEELTDYMKDAEFKIKKPSVLIEACKAIDEMHISEHEQGVPACPECHLADEVEKRLSTFTAVTSHKSAAF